MEFMLERRRILEWCRGGVGGAEAIEEVFSENIKLAGAGR